MGLSPPFFGVSVKHWDSYWLSTETLSSFAQSNHKDGYQGDVLNFWNAIFREFQSSAKLLDIGCGNGALAVLAEQYPKEFEITAIDAANIDPTKHFNDNEKVSLSLKNINFYSEMCCEKLNFNDSSFDYLISQFGIEYSDLNFSFLEANRVLKSGGELIALVHHRNSFITQDCQQGIKVLSQFVNQDGLAYKVRNFVNFCSNYRLIEKPTAKEQNEFLQNNEKLLLDFKKVQINFNSEIEQDWFGQLAKSFIPMIVNWREVAVHQVESLIEELANYKLRINEQIEASWSEDDQKAIISNMSSSWETFDITPKKIDGELFCWVLRAKKLQEKH